MKTIKYVVYEWPACDLYIAATEKGLCRIEFANHQSERDFVNQLLRYGAHVEKEADFFEKILSAFDRYFGGEKERFDLPLDLQEGTPFQRRVWDRVRRIEYGRTRTYREIAAELGKPGAARAVGAANGANPIPIVIPCHRVVASDGKLGGYRGGLEIKERLLRLEGALL